MNADERREVMKVRPEGDEEEGPIVICEPYLKKAQEATLAGDLDAFWKVLDEALPGHEEWVRANFKAFAESDIFRKQGGEHGRR